MFLVTFSFLEQQKKYTFIAYFKYYIVLQYDTNCNNNHHYKNISLPCSGEMKRGQNFS